MRRQTATSGINPAGSSRALRLDPLSLPVSFNAHDTRADGGVRQIELHRERVVLRISSYLRGLEIRSSRGNSEPVRVFPLTISTQGESIC